MSIIIKNPTSNPRLASNELAPPNHPSPVLSSLILCSNPVFRTRSVITTLKDLEPFCHAESYNLVSYIRDIKKVYLFQNGQNTHS